MKRVRNMSFWSKGLLYAASALVPLGLVGNYFRVRWYKYQFKLGETVYGKIGCTFWLQLPPEAGPQEYDIQSDDVLVEAYAYDQGPDGSASAFNVELLVKMGKGPRTFVVPILDPNSGVTYKVTVVATTGCTRRV